VNEKLESLLKQMQESGSSEAIAIADMVLNTIACDDSDDETIDLAIAVADEFIGWGETIRKLTVEYS